MRLVALAFTICTVGTQLLPGAPLTRIERQRLIAHLEMTRTLLDQQVNGLSQAQLKFRPAPGNWCVLDVLEHLTIAEPVYWQQVQDSLKTTTEGKKTQASDADILWYGIDRTQKQKTEASKEPVQQLPNAKAGLDQFQKLHEQMIQFAKTTDEDLRNHIVEKEGIDTYQWLLGISTHEQRHILQILEIKSDPKFPKS